MRTFIEHSVMFLLGEDEGDVLLSRYGYARLRAVTVHLRPKGPMISASGDRCRKNGEPDGRMGGRVCVPVDLPDPALWIDRAVSAVQEEA